MSNENRLQTLRKLSINTATEQFEPTVKFLIESLSNFEESFNKELSEKFNPKHISPELVALLEIRETTGNSIAKAVIIVIDSYMKQSFKQSGLKINYWESTKDYKWARSVHVFSNYIRHRHEWDIPTHNLFFDKATLVISTAMDIISQIKRGDTKRNIEFIQSIGFDAKDWMVRSKDITYNLAIKCNLHKLEPTVENYKLWIKYLESRM